eukprot:217775_1
MADFEERKEDDERELILSSHEKSEEKVKLQSDDVNETDTKKELSLEYIAGLAIHLLSWTVVITLSFFPVPLFLIIGVCLIILFLVFIGVGVCMIKTMEIFCPETCCDVCCVGNIANCCSICLVVLDAARSRQYIFQLEVITGISMMLNLYLIWSFGEKVSQISYFKKISDFVMSMPFSWKIAIAAFMITYSLLILIEGIIEVVSKLQKKKGSSPRYDRACLDTLVKNKDGLVFHYALIAGFVAMTLCIMTDQIEMIIADKTKVDFNKIWLWTTLIWGNSYGGYKIIRKIAVFMAKNFVLFYKKDEHRNRCRKCMRSCNVAIYLLMWTWNTKWCLQLFFTTNL